MHAVLKNLLNVLLWEQKYFLSFLGILSYSIKVDVTNSFVVVAPSPNDVPFIRFGNGFCTIIEQVPILYQSIFQLI